MEKSDTELKILHAAKKVFVRKGLYGARMQEIADEAGINKALLHYYFRSKEKLFQTIFQEAFHKFAPSTFGLMASDAPIEEKIKMFVANYIDTISDNPFLPVFIINEINQNPERLTQITNMMGNLSDVIAKQLEEKVQSGEYRPVDPMQLFSNIVAMSIFPFLAKPIITRAFTLDDNDFKKLLQERKTIIPEMIFSYLKNV
jgi:AcrR family transcriptional regulator